MARDRGVGTLRSSKRNTSVKQNPRVSVPSNARYSPPRSAVGYASPPGAKTGYSSGGYTGRGYSQSSGGGGTGGGTGGGGGGFSGGSGGGFSSSGGGGFSAPAPIAPPSPPPAPPKWEELSAAAQRDYLNSDATYTAQKGSLEQELENLIAELALQRKNYGAEHSNTLRNLGWSQELNAFDPNNQLGAYGMANENMQNDFASRGMMDSSAFAEGLSDLNTSFNQQLGDINNAKTRFENELSTREQGGRESQAADLNRARADAIARRAARLGLV